MLVAEGLKKRFGAVTAVDDLSFDVGPGVVTGFLGPNGSGKSTTMRMFLGLDRPTAGRATVNGTSYVDLPAPLREVGALLEARAVHTGRSARNHLRALAAANAIPQRRVDEVLGLVGLEHVAGKRVGAFSLGMGQRLGLAAALLGDPAVLLLDEPVNGLDPEGIRWIRGLLQRLAAEGRTVFVSSHLMSEMALTATELIVIGRGRLVARGTVSELTQARASTVLVRSDDPTRLAQALTGAGGVVAGEDGGLTVTGMTSREIGRVAADHGIALVELTPQSATLEEAFMEITREDVEFHAEAETNPAGSR